MGPMGSRKEKRSRGSGGGGVWEGNSPGSVLLGFPWMLTDQQVTNINKCHVASDPRVTAVITTVPGLLPEFRVLRAEH